MTKIQILGYSGSGKSTLARRLADRYDAKYVELDALFWLENWQEKPTSQFKKDVRKALTTPKWVVCGAYTSRLDGYTLKQADTLVILEYRFMTILYRLLKRQLKRLVTREQLWGNNRESLFQIINPSKSLVFYYLKAYREYGRYHYYDKVRKFDHKAKVIRLKTPKDTKKWLMGIS